MRTSILLTSLFATSLLPAQIVAIPAMTQLTSVVDMDAAGPAGPTTVAALNAAGTNGGALLAGITLTPSTAALGVYNTNTQLGLGLGLLNNQLTLIAPSGQFDSFDAQIDLLVPSTEFGIAIADWVSTMVLEFRMQSVVVGTITTAAYGTPDAKFFQSTQPFDQVLVRASTAAGNWVIPELHVQIGFGGTPASNATIGAGCGGLTLTANTRPIVGTAWSLALNGVPANATVGVEIFGLSDPGLDNLASLGLPGCGLRASLDFLNAFVAGSPTHAYGLALPNNPQLLGISVFTTGAVFQNPPTNPFGAITANGIHGSLGDV